MFQLIRKPRLFAFKDTITGDILGADKNSWNREKFYATRGGAENFLKKVKVQQSYKNFDHIEVVELQLSEVKTS